MGTDRNVASLLDAAWRRVPQIAVAQGTTEAEGFTVISVTCNRRWHRVQFGLRLGSGTFQPGKATLIAQFLVFNVETGDPAAAHEHTTVVIHRDRT